MLFFSLLIPWRLSTSKLTVRPGQSKPSCPRLEYNNGQNLNSEIRTSKPDTRASLRHLNEIDTLEKDKHLQASQHNR